MGGSCSHARSHKKSQGPQAQPPADTRYSRGGDEHVGGASVSVEQTEPTKVEFREPQGGIREPDEQKSSTKSLGVRASVFAAVQRACKLRGPPLATTKDVSDAVIMPATAATRSSFIELLQTSPPEWIADCGEAEGVKGLVGPASSFVSHAWKYLFDDVVDCIFQAETNAPGSYYWFDLFANNQHVAPDLPFSWWCSTFKDNIRAIGRVDLVMAPWEKPIPITRAWCLWEIYSAIDVGAQVRIVIPTTQHAPFRKAIMDVHTAILQGILDVDVNTAMATNPVDRERIFKAIEATVGVAKLNSSVKTVLRQKFLDLASEFSKSSTCSRLLYQVGIILASFGRNDLAKDCLERVKAAASATEEGSAHCTACTDECAAPRQDQIDMALGEIAFAEERLSDAALLYAAARRHQLQRTHSHDAPAEFIDDCVQTLLGLSRTCGQQGRTTDALKYAKEAVKVSKNISNGESSSRAHALIGLGLCYAAQGNPKKGLQCLDVARDLMTKNRLNNTPEMAAVLIARCGVLAQQGHCDQGHDGDITASVALVTDTLGADHPDAIGLRNAMSSLQCDGKSRASDVVWSLGKIRTRVQNKRREVNPLQFAASAVVRHKSIRYRCADNLALGGSDDEATGRKQSHVFDENLDGKQAVQAVATYISSRKTLRMKTNWPHV